MLTRMLFLVLIGARCLKYTTVYNFNLLSILNKVSQIILRPSFTSAHTHRIGARSSSSDQLKGKLTVVVTVYRLYLRVAVVAS